MVQKNVHYENLLRYYIAETYILKQIHCQDDDLSFMSPEVVIKTIFASFIMHLLQISNRLNGVHNTLERQRCTVL